MYTTFSHRYTPTRTPLLTDFVVRRDVLHVADLDQLGELLHQVGHVVGSARHHDGEQGLVLRGNNKFDGDWVL